MGSHVVRLFVWVIERVSQRRACFAAALSVASRRRPSSPRRMGSGAPPPPAAAPAPAWAHPPPTLREVPLSPAPLSEKCEEIGKLGVCVVLCVLLCVFCEPNLWLRM